MYTIWILPVATIVTITHAALIRVPLHKNEKYIGSSEQLLGHRAFLRSRNYWNQLDTTVTESVYEPKYFANISLGTPPQEFSVIFDTGLSLTWIYGDCVGKGHNYDDSSDDCPDWEGFQPNKSTTLKYVRLPFDATFSGSEFLEGPVATDVLQLQGISIKQQVFALENELNDIKLTGWGLFALGSTETFQHPPPLKNMYEQKIISNLVFSTYLKPADSANIDTFSGEIIFGGSDPTLYLGNLTYASLTKGTGKYEFQADNINFMGSKLCQPCTTEVVSTVSTFGGPSDMVSMIVFMLVVSTNENNQIIMDCDTAKSQPDFIFDISGEQFKVSISQLLTPVNATDCIVNIESLPGSNWIIGDAFLTNYYTEFDIENLRIGFAPLATDIPTASEPTQPPKSSPRKCKSKSK